MKEKTDCYSRDQINEEVAREVVKYLDELSQSLRANENTRKLASALLKEEKIDDDWLKELSNMYNQDDTKAQERIAFYRA